MFRPLICAISLSLIFTVSYTAENAALQRHGAAIHVTSKAKKPINDKWNKAPKMLKETKPAGPIINDLASGKITVTLPVPLTVQQVGIKPSDYRGSIALAKDISISSPDAETKKYTLEQKPGELQFLDYAAKTNKIIVEIHSIYDPIKPGKKKIAYGTVDQVQVIVEEVLAERFATPKTYIPNQTQFIMQTDNLNPQKVSPVIGKPFKVDAHPKTIWSQQEIDEFKGAIKKQKKAKEAYDGIISSCEKIIENAFEVPDEPDLGTNPKVANLHTAIAQGIANLGIGYALSGDERYAEECKRLLMGMADKYESYPRHSHPKFTHDSSKWSWQRLGDAIWLIPAAWGYDLIHNSKALSDEDRAKIEDKFIMPCVKEIMRSSSIIGAPTNWSVICCAAVMIGARVCDNEEYYKRAMLGNKGDKKQGIYFHLDKGIDDDGMWAEGAIGYQFMAIRGLIVMAEIMWHDGIDIYSYRDNRLKFVFDSPIWYCYPGGSSAPAVHDSGSASLYGRDAHLYQYALRRYGDKTYNSILHKVTPTFESIYNLFLPACDFSEVDAADLPPIPSILFPGVGFTINRTGFGEDSKYLFMDYGPNRSHGHDDKLNFNVFALGEELFGDGGSAWYSTDLYKKYFPYSQAHNTLSANEQTQIRSGGRLEAYGTAADMALIRATSDKAIPGGAMDRTMLMSDGRVYDIFWYTGGIPFSLDLCYHGHGSLEEKLTTGSWDECPKEKNGYAYFKDPRIGQVDGDWKATWKVKRGHVDMHYVGEKGSSIVSTTTPKGGKNMPTIMIRRHGTETVYAGVMDIVKKGETGTIQSIKKQQSNEAYLLHATLVDGTQEIVLVNYTPNKISLGDWSFDGRVAFVQMKNGVLTRLYLAGGTQLQGAGLDITTSSPSLIAYQQVKDGLAGVWNQSNTETSLIINKLPAFESVVSNGNKVALSNGTMLVSANGSVELHQGQQVSIQKYLDQQMIDKRNALIAKEAAQRAELSKAYEAQMAKAKEINLPTDTIVLVQAEDLSEQQGGKVNITDKKTATHGSAFSGWNNRDHSLHYTFEVDKPGLYQMHIKYCREGDEQLRSIEIDGEFPNEYAKEMVFPGTGGWSNGSDNWKLIPLTWGVLDKPFLIHLDKGTHKLKLNNLSGAGLNLDYVVFTAPGSEVTKQSVEK